MPYHNFVWSPYAIIFLEGQIKILYKFIVSFIRNNFVGVLLP